MKKHLKSKTITGKKGPVNNNVVRVKCTVNGREYTVNVPHHYTLLDMLRRTLKLTGTKEGCGEGECGTCTVILDGKPVNSCICLASKADGCDILTIEGVWNPVRKKLHPVQDALIKEGGVQCGFCTPGLVISSVAYMKKAGRYDQESIKEALAGNICRCTGYKKIFTAVRKAMSEKKGKE